MNALDVYWFGPHSFIGYEVKVWFVGFSAVGAFFSLLFKVFCHMSVLITLTVDE